MKITIDKCRAPVVPFEELERGTVFTIATKPFFKDNIYVMLEPRHQETKSLALHVQSWEMISFERTAQAQPLEANLVVEAPNA
jgi:hypothetical protein